MTSDIDPLTLSREELYDLVWSKPMVELARDFGLSDASDRIATADSGIGSSGACELVRPS
jgi:hypothetical protein